ncbi:MAG: metallophosphoesterase [Phycisphaeraceae bacterium]|nr:metallophosphoesterase [Phycisphaerae bacterium]MBX3391718.1 metallophosphoesterase [Phycisphaeraceae bacterium]
MKIQDLQSSSAVIDALARGAEANRRSACRTGSIDRIEAPGRLVATGDLHDNPVHFDRLVTVAGLDGQATDPAHLTLHELIHGDRLINGMDFSYRVLTRTADLKARHPEHVHVLLGNHELSQIAGAGIVKDGVRVVEAFNQGVDYVFGGDADDVRDAITDFVRSMPLALRCVCPRGDILCVHSVPPAAIMQRFDPSVLTRDLRDDDYEPRRGSAHLMVWGRGYDAELLEDLTERWGVYLFILGHEKAEDGARFIPPNALVLNSDHERGVYLPIDLSDPPRPEESIRYVARISSP